MVMVMVMVMVTVAGPTVLAPIQNLACSVRPS
jgi:hypothetical protein